MIVRMDSGDEVGWKWGNGIAIGTVIQVCRERTEIESKGTLIVRNGTVDDPAIIIRSRNRSLVLKRKHELQKLK